MAVISYGLSSTCPPPLVNLALPSRLRGLYGGWSVLLTFHFS